MLARRLVTATLPTSRAPGLPLVELELGLVSGCECRAACCLGASRSSPGSGVGVGVQGWGLLLPLLLPPGRSVLFSIERIRGNILQVLLVSRWFCGWTWTGT